MNNTEFQARNLGELMCRVTNEVLWQPAAGWVQQQAAGSTLVCRVGSGQATYHRFSPQRKQHQITYGLRMIQAKHQPETAVGWLSAREIHRRGYFDGEISPLNLLAHTCCHEFAHLLQHNAGQRYRGSVHNGHFYSILDELHGSGGADSVKRALAEQATQLGMPVPEQAFVLPGSGQQQNSWHTGDAVLFGQGPREFQGEITRVNRKTCTVDGTGRFQGRRYRVPMQMLRRAT